MQAAMQIERVERDGCPELEVSGRMDSYGSRNIADSMEELMREGARHVRLNLSKTTYMSSAGIRVLVQGFQQFAAVGGTLRIVEPSVAVRQILELAGLGSMMAEPAPAEEVKPETPVQTRVEAGFTFEIHKCSPGARLLCRIAGHPEPLVSEGFGEKDCDVFSVPAGLMSLGLGAFGESYAECRERFGEFLAVAGCAACQPTDETGYADYMVSAGSLVPRLATLYSVSCKGPFEKFVRFDSQAESEPIGLSQVVMECMETSGAELAGMVMMAESSGVLGASLKHSPAARHEAMFHHPEVRQWLSFSPVRSYPRSVLLVAGVAAKLPCPGPLAPMVRPLKRDASLAGHFHAAVFGYRPLRKGYIELEESVKHLFDGGGLQSVLHLLADDRVGSGTGETELMRGACWVGPISRILAPEETL